MRLQLSRRARAAPRVGWLAIAVLGAAAASSARADGTLAARGVYYKERATRVMQPMLDGMFDAGVHGIVTGHFLVDAITSASVSSGAANAAAFTEQRYEGGVGYVHELGALTVAGDAKYSTESDYTSLYAGLRGQLELFQKTTVIGLGAGVSLDTASAAAAQGLALPSLRCDAAHPAEASCDLDVYAGFGSISQIVGPNLVISASVDVATLRGYQSNPYRQAIAGETLVPERHPTERTREAFAASARYYVSPTRTTLVAAYRYYRDTWKVHAHTPELRLVQEVGASADATFGYRHYRQDGAYFFRDRYPADDAEMTRFVSDDVKLSTFTGHTLEAKLGVRGDAFELTGSWAGARFEGILEYAVQHNRFGNAVIAHVALTLPFEY
jgi:hypothetical protein